MSRRGAALALAVALSTAYAAAQASAQGSGAAFAPKLHVEPTPYVPLGDNYLAIDVTQTPAETRLARASVVIPSGYIVQPVKLRRRFAHATVTVAGETKNHITPLVELKGDLGAVKPRKNSCVAKPLASFQGELKGSQNDAPNLNMKLTVYSEKIAGARRLTYCLPSSTGKIRQVSLHVIAGLLPPGPGKHRWRAVFSPAATSAAVARRRSTESQAVVTLPSWLTLKALGPTTVTYGSYIHLTGNLSLYGFRGARRVQILAAHDRRGFVKVTTTHTTGGAGRYSVRFKAPSVKGRYYYEARVSSSSMPCATANAEAPAGCTSASLNGISSTTVGVVVK